MYTVPAVTACHGTTIIGYSRYIVLINIHDLITSDGQIIVIIHDPVNLPAMPVNNVLMTANVSPHSHHNNKTSQTPASKVRIS